MKDSTEFIKALGAFASEFLNGCVIFHMDKETKEVKSITPICPVDNTQELYRQLAHCRDGIQHFLNQLVDKGLAKN